ncbi:uncharacterized protein LOC106651992 [Trichogramma pretiosum]|uniref:uncharacterized protein LOC106651992 n=1 Tax=Trichogramma pretiosum TaxID=7493 RepID=UPI0006C973D2|nr:uncharacterized protein LOC106651992 [Trichogramma pretiosum]
MTEATKSIPIENTWDFTTQAELSELSRQLDFEENHFYWLKKFLKFVFLCPVQPKIIQKSGRAMMHSTFIFSITVTCTKAYKELFVNEIYPPMLAELAFQLIVLSTTYIIYLQAIGMEKEVRIRIQSLKNPNDPNRMCEIITIDWLGINDPEEKDIMRVVCERGSRLIFIHFGVLLPCFMGYAFAPVALPYILNRYLPENKTLKRSLCVHVEVFIDQDKYFNFILCFVIHMIMLVLLITCALDLAYTSCITYIMGKIIWIGRVFEKLNEVNIYDQSPSLKQKANIYIHQTVIGLIKRHQKCLDFSQTLNDACSPKFIIVVASLVILLSLSGSMAVVELSYDVSSAAKMTVAFTVLLVIVLVMCYPSQLMLDASHDIYFKCYSSKWYEYPVRTRRLLILMMIKAAEPCCMTIGPTTPLNFNTAGKIIKTALSYVTTLVSLCAL